MFAVANALPEAVVNPADLVPSTNGTRIPGIRLWFCRLDHDPRPFGAAPNE
jgi:hypothetical protein